MARPKGEKTLESVLGEDYLQKVYKLREKFVEVIKLEGSTIEEVSLRTGVNIATIMEFIRGNKVYRTNMLSEAGPRKNRPPRDNIAVKTYEALKKYTIKRLRILDEND